MLRLLRCPLNEPSELGASPPHPRCLWNVLKLQLQRKNSVTQGSNFCIRRKTPSTALNNTTHESDYGLEFCWLSGSLRLINWGNYSSSDPFGLQVCMETQRFEKLMEYFKNEDSNIDFMVCKYVHSKQTHTHTHTQPNGLLIALQSLKNQTSLCQLEAAPVRCETPGEHRFLFKWSKRELCFCACAQAASPDVRKFKHVLCFYTAAHALYLSEWTSMKWLTLVPYTDPRRFF